MKDALLLAIFCSLGFGCNAQDVVACKIPDSCGGPREYHLLSTELNGGLKVKGANQQTDNSEFIIVHDYALDDSVTIQRWTDTWKIRDIFTTRFRLDAVVLHSGDPNDDTCTVLRKGSNTNGHYSVVFEACEE